MAAPGPDPPPSPDEARVFELLLKTGLEARDALRLLLEIRDMAAANLIARFESKLDGQNAKFDAVNANIEALKDQLRRERAMLWAVIALLGAAVMRYLLVG